jgi:hypothetical protein
MSEPSPAVGAVRGALTTSRHAGLLFDSVAELLGERGHLETAGQGSWRRLFRRDDDAEWLVPWPLLRLRLGGRMSFVTDWMQTGTGKPAPPVPTPPRREVRMRGLGPAELEIRDGDWHLTITYGEDGTVLETARSAELGAIASLAPGPDEAPDSEVQRLARRVCALDVASRGPARVRMPVPLPTGVEGIWHCARSALRRALFDGRVHATASWLAADGLAGTALAHGTSRDNVLSEWLRVACRVKPRRQTPEAPPPSFDLPPPGEGRELGDGSIILSGPPAADVPWPPLQPEDLPAAAVALRPLPAGPPPVGCWLRLLGERGSTALAVLRRDPDGLTIIGEEALAAVDLDLLDRHMDAAAAELAGRVSEVDWPADRPPLTCAVHGFRVAAGKLACDELQHSTEWDAAGLDGDRLAARVLRCRRLR